jgi:large subunit ribosomal protein L9
MKVILLKDIAKLGKRGEVKEVADGYAINVLVKKEMASLATPQELAKWKQKDDAVRHKKELAASTFLQLVDSLRKSHVVISGRKHDDKGQLFAAIRDVDIADAVFSVTQLSIDPKQIFIDTPIKHIGEHTVILKQGEKKELIKITVQ